MLYIEREGERKRVRKTQVFCLFVKNHDLRAIEHILIVDEMDSN